MIGKRLSKIIHHMLLIFFTLKEKKCPVYISKINSICEKQIILLIIPSEGREGWHYPSVKKYVHYYME